MNGNLYCNIFHPSPFETQLAEEGSSLKIVEQRKQIILHMSKNKTQA